MSPTRLSAMSWIRHILIHLCKSSLSLSEGGANMLIMAMRYMWSEMDSPRAMPNRRHPSRLVVLSRSRMWKYGTGESEFSAGGPAGIVARTLGTVHSPGTLGNDNTEGSGALQSAKRTLREARSHGWLHTGAGGWHLAAISTKRGIVHCARRHSCSCGCLVGSPFLMVWDSKISSSRKGSRSELAGVAFKAAGFAR